MLGCLLSMFFREVRLLNCNQSVYELMNYNAFYVFFN